MDGSAFSAGLLAGNALPVVPRFDFGDTARADDHLFLHYRRGV